MVPVVQLVRASDCGSECRRFESVRAPHKKGDIAAKQCLFFVSGPTGHPSKKETSLQSNVFFCEWTAGIPVVFGCSCRLVPREKSHRLKERNHHDRKKRCRFIFSEIFCIDKKTVADTLTGVLLYQNMIFDSCFRLLPNGDGRGNDVIVIKSPACKLQVGL